ncbi:MAG: iron chelate uptake ABC transporter family permease subunit, partial [Rickettsiales bacterium]
MRINSVFLYVILTGLVLLMAMLSLKIGYTPLSFEAVFHGLFSSASNDVTAIVIQEIRLPRTLLAVLVGATLGLSGAALQGFLRNPLAEPGLLGVSNGAALGAVVAMYGGWAAATSFGLPVAAMAGAMAAV